MNGVFPARPKRFHVSGTWQTYNQQVLLSAVVDSERREWFATDHTNMTVSSYSGGTVRNGSESHPASDYRASITTPLLALIFPEHLPVWGRGVRDTDEPLTVTDVGENRTLVILRSHRDAALRKSLVISKSLGIVERYYDALSATVVSEVTEG